MFVTATATTMAAVKIAEDGQTTTKQYGNLQKGKGLVRNILSG